MLLHRLNVFVSRILEHLISVLVGLLAALVFFQVLNRFLIKVPAAWTEEGARIVFVWLCLMASAKAGQEGAHLGVDMLMGTLPRRFKKWVAALASLLSMVFYYVVLRGGLAWIAATGNNLCDSMTILLKYVYVILPISMGLMMLSEADSIYQQFAEVSFAEEVRH